MGTHLEVLVDDHADGAERGGEEPHHQLHLHHQRVRHGAAASPRGAPVRELDQRQDEPVQRRGAEGEGEAHQVLRLRGPRGAVGRDVQAQHGGARRQQRHGVHGRRRQPLAHDEEREEHRERELRRDEYRGGGHRQVPEAVRVDEVVGARGEAERRGGEQDARRGEKDRGGPVARAAGGVGSRHGDQQQRPAGGLEPRREPLPVAALVVVEAGEERPRRGAQCQHPAVERHQKAARQLAAGLSLRRVLVRFHVHDCGRLPEIGIRRRNLPTVASQNCRSLRFGCRHGSRTCHAGLLLIS
ncbi:hypothetical protein GQ55_2G286400 [Panicum hallii var. hallii]|uniref:Uncharacterized protein n=1 Tax=Panicum hallii var. hallii TaxID=1504633 RepID=A0A2T7ETE0_9POAL|nr:hypothetical protein GQ55_2G286400 [Panicum hallii var. hallii]